jgi:anthranilate synthase component 2
MRILIVDNYDSFTFNLSHYFEKIDNLDVVVLRNDELEIEAIQSFDAIVFSPGPGLPLEAGKMMQVIEKYYNSKPMLGVCLGHQALAEFFGAQLKNLPRVYHGVSTSVKIVEDHFIFNGLPSIFNVGRYHSWAVEESTMPISLKIICKSEDNEIMMFVHKSLPITGIQFHPESILTPQGMQLLVNWLDSIKVVHAIKNSSNS